MLLIGILFLIFIGFLIPHLGSNQTSLLILQNLIWSLVIILILFLVLYIPEDKGIEAKSTKSENLNKLMVVAHPDDEVLWGFNQIRDQTRNKELKVICITSADNPVRRKEFKRVMDQCNIHNWEMWSESDSIFAWKLSESTKKKIKREINKYHYKYIYTHNWYGEYGHLQHMAVSKLINDLCCSSKKPIILKNFNNNCSPRFELLKEELMKIYSSQSLINCLLTPIKFFYY